MTGLVFITDESQVGHVLRRPPGGPEGTRLVTGDLAAALALEKAGIPFLEEWEFLSASDIARNAGAAHDLSLHWWDERKGRIEARGISLTDAARQDLVWPFEVCLNARTTYERLFASVDVRRVSGFFPLPVPVCRTAPPPVFRAATTVALAVLRWMAELRGIPVSFLKTCRPLSCEGPLWRPFGVRPGVPRQPDAGRAGERVLLLLDTGLRSVEQDALAGHFGGAPGWRVVRLSAWDLLPVGGRSGETGNGVPENDLEAGWNCLISPQAAYSGPHPEIFRNPHLRFQFRRIWSEMRTAARVGEAFETVLDTVRPSLIVLGHDAFTIERTIVRLAQGRGIPTASLIHGGLAHAMSFRGLTGDADHLMVWGDEDVRQLTRCGVDPARLKRVGSVQYDGRYRGGHPRLPEGSPPRQARARERLGIPVDRRVVLYLTSATNAGMAQPIADPRRHRQTWRELVELAARRSDFTFLVKPHPSYDHFQFYRLLCADAPPNVVLRENAALDDALDACDVAVLVNYCTTAALEAMLSGIPLVFLRTAIYPTPEHADFLEVHGTVPAGSVGELEILIRRLTGDGEFRRHVLADHEEALRSIFGEKDRPALERISAEFEAIALPPPPPGGAGPASSDGSVAQDVVGVGRRLWENGGAGRFLSAWKDLSGSFQGRREPPDASFGRALSGIMFAIGVTSRSPRELRSLAREVFAVPVGGSPGTLRNFRGTVLVAYLNALARCVNEGRWDAARSFSLAALRDTPVDAVRAGIFRTLFVKHLLGSSRWALRLVNALGYARQKAVRGRPARYLET